MQDREKLMSLTKKELVALCKEKGLTVSEKRRKDDIVDIYLGTEEKGEPSPKETLKENQGFKDNIEALTAERPKKRKWNRGAGRRMYRKDDSVITIESGDRHKKVTTDEERYERTLIQSFTTYKELLATLKKQNQGKAISPDAVHVNERTPKQLVIRGKMRGMTDPRRVTGQNVNFAICEYGPFMVYIPINEFFSNWRDLEGGDIRSFMRNRIGSYVDFVVTNVVEAEPKKIYVASRIIGMEQRRKDWWFGRVSNEVNKYGEHPYVMQDGKVAQASITAVTKKIVFAECLGAEVRIPVAEMTHGYLSDARKYFHVGQSINVRLSQITRENGPGFPVAALASVRSAVNDPKEINFYKYPPEHTFDGYVTNITSDTGENVYFVNVGGENGEPVDVYAKMMPSVHLLPEEGDRVQVYIEDNDEDTFRIWGKITHVYPV